MTDYMTPEQVADMLPRFNRDSVYKALKTGALEGFQPTGPGGPWLIKPEAVDAWITAGSNSVRRRRRRAA